MTGSPDLRVAQSLVIERVPADSQDAAALIAELDLELQRRYPGAAIAGLRPEEARDPRLTFFVARIAGRPAGCAALRELEPRAGEVKRMFVRGEYRGRGVARGLLAALEARARELGYGALRLETGEGQPEAMALYTAAGYAPIPSFGPYAGNPYSRCFEKQLV